MADISSNLLYYYKFDTQDLSGTTLKNWATGAYDALCSSTSIISNSNFYIGSSALNLDGTNYISKNAVTCFSSNFAVSFWISSLLNQPISVNSRRVFEYNTGTSGWFACIITNNVLRIYSNSSISSSGNANNVSCTININSGIWQHYIISYTSATKVLNIYINGKLNLTSTLTYAINTQSSSTLYIGTDYTNTYNFIGTIDDFRIYNYAITSLADINYLLYYPNYKKYTNSTSSSTLLTNFNSNFYDVNNQNIIFDYEPRSIIPGTILLLLGDPTNPISNKGNYTNTVTFSSTNQSIFNSNSSSLYVVDSSAGSISIVNLFSGTINFIQNPSSIEVENRYNISTGISSIAFDTTNTYYYVANGSYVQQMNYATNLFIKNINTDALTTIKYCITDSNNIIYISHNTGIKKINLSGTIPATSTTILTTTIGMSQMANSPVYPNELYAIDISNTKIYVINTVSNAKYELTLPASFINSTAILTSLCFDSFGNLYVSTSKGTYAIYMIPNYILNTYSVNRTLTTTEIVIYAGIGGTTLGTTGYTGDGSTCYNALFKNISNIMMDGGNNMYICDSSNASIRKIINKIVTTNFLNTITDEMGMQSQYDISTLYSPTYSFTTNQISNYCIGDITTFIDADIKASNYNVINNANLVLYYRFNSMDVSGVNLANYSTGYPLYDASLSAVGLVNSNDYVIDNSAFNNIASGNIKINNSVLTANSWPTTNGLSVAFWVKSNSGYSSNSSARFLDFGNSASPTYSFFVSPSGTDLCGNIVLTYGAIKGGAASVYYTDYAINNNIWHHVCISLTYNTSVNSIHNVYIDGSLYYTGTGVYPTTTTYTSCYIGKSNFVADPSFNGSIDDFRLYNRILSAAEVSSLYNLGTNTVSLVDLRSGAIPVLTVSNVMSDYTISNDSTPIRNGVYTIGASSTGGPTLRGMYAFDSSNATYHESSGTRYTNGVYNTTVSTSFSNNTSILGEWSQIKLPYMLKLTSYTVINNPSFASVSIKSYVLAGSTDDVTWDYIDYVDMGSNPVLSFTVDLNTYTNGNGWTWTYQNLAQKYYNYFRFIGISMSSGSTKYRLAGLNLFGIGKYITNVPITTEYTSFEYNSIPILTANTTVISGYTPSNLNGTYIASASSQYGASYPAYNAFDYDVGTFWHSASGLYTSSVYTGNVSTTVINSTSSTINILGEWIQIQLPYALSLSGYYMLPRSSSFYTQFPKSWYLVGSNNGSTWYAIDFTSAYTPTTMNYSSDFGNSYANYNYYSYFRIIIVTTNSAGVTSINQIQLWGKAILF